MKKLVALLLILLLIISGVSLTAVAETASAEDGIVFGYISPGPDTWYLRAEEGFAWACEKAGVGCITVNSNRDSNTEYSNIEYLINEGVQGIGILSFNESGVVTCATMCAEAGIGCVVIDAAGAVINNNIPHTASVDFDWAAMGVTYAEYMAATYPGENYVIITGTFDSVACQVINNSMQETSAALGQNEFVDLRAGEYNPNVAADVAEDLVNADLDFSIIFVMNEDMAAAVITRLDDMGVLDQYHVIAQNGSPVGVTYFGQGLDFTTATSPGWEAAIAAFALYDGLYSGAEQSKQIMCPFVAVTAENKDDPYTVIPWEADEVVFPNLTTSYFPEYAYFFK